jgi:pimeloyl-ACP methyl ester carboxylesterase
MSVTEPIVYLHGQPGGPSEIEAFGGAARWFAAERLVLSRQAINRRATLSQHFDALASGLKVQFGSSPFRLVGFSLGAYVALEVASRMGSAVSHISLVSAAAPLSRGDFLPDMAGRIVFRAARHSPFLFAALTSAQSLLLHAAPEKLFDALFATAQGLDRDLAVQPHFRAKIIDALKYSLHHGATGYRNELRGYVQDWSAVLPLVTQPIELWHGNLDNWAPPQMADALADALPNVTMLHRLEGHSHYSTLQAFFERAAGIAEA